MFRRIRTIIAAAALAFAAAAGARAEEPYAIEWMRQLGTWASDRSYGVAADALGNVFTGGWTSGSLGRPNPRPGYADAFVSKYDASGQLLWTRQLGTTRDDYGHGVAADHLGNSFITGRTEGSLGGPNAGSYDAFVSKCDASGSLLWTRQLGTSAWEESYGVAADPLGNIFISGYTGGSLGGPNAGDRDAFVSKYDSSGNLLWTRQLGTSSYDSSRGVAADPLGNVFISGSTTGSLGGPNAGGWDAFVSKYDGSGGLLWTRQLGTSVDDGGGGVAVDHLGNVFISGSTHGSLGGPNAGSWDALVSKYDSSGNLLWTRQLGTVWSDYGFGVAADPLGSVFISGYTEGSLGGPNAGGYDAFVSKYDASGNLLWTCQVGTPESDESWGVAADPLGNVFFSGKTQGSLGGPNAAHWDAFLVKLTVPEPATILIVTAAGLPMLLKRRRNA